MQETYIRPIVKVFVLLIFLYCATLSSAQTSLKVLFLGNSYTAVNNLPQIVHDVALSAGDTLIFDSYTPGGYQLADHSTDSVGLNKIMTGDWNYVVLQGQSQEPVINSGTFINGGTQLNSVIRQFDPCSVTMLYMTWGRKNGDVSNCPAFPVMCTYEGMDTTIRNKYFELASFIKGEISPVSIVWKYLRQNYPGIELYQTDESHPSVEGSYAAACCFYSTIFKKDPTAITFDFGLSSSDAAVIRNAVKTQAFDSLNLWDYKLLPVSDFSYSIGPGSNEVIFNALAHGTAETYAWDFGDSTTSSLPNPTHSYLYDGVFTVSLTTTNCDLQGLHTSMTDTVIHFCNHTPTIYTSHPWLCTVDTLWTQTADSYQWYSNGVPIPDTSQFITDYQNYMGNVSVVSTINGCSELSVAFTETPVWSGYYFDILPVGDPCAGDTVPFAVLNINGALSGSEVIQWYRNDSLLTFAANEDTLFINSGGAYECRVIDPNSNCPLDTTSYLMVFDCGTAGVDNNVQDFSWSVFPNPASNYIYVSGMFEDGKDAELSMFNSLGEPVIEKHFSPRSENQFLDLENFKSGLYFCRITINGRIKYQGRVLIVN